MEVNDSRAEADDAALVELWLRVRAGNPTALGELLDRFRPLLKAAARESLQGVGARIGESDIAQQACLSAVRDFADFRGDQLGQFLAWLSALNERAVLDAVRKHEQTAKRAVTREIDNSAAIRGAAAIQPTASERLMRNERVDLVRREVERLPEGQREAVKWRYLDGLTLSEIARRLNRSEQAVAGLLKRGLAALRRTGNDT